MTAQLAAFAQTAPFELDPFQVAGCAAIEAGRGVLVAAPTGAGKTLVGEFAVHLALERGVKAFYTTPIKALSNQKFSELSEKYGRHRIGLLTGDSSINGEADIVVMTTEVLRNMIYAGSSTLDHLGYVVMDEVHYLADRTRGAVWEEVIIGLPEQVVVVSLSATISNAEEFGAWLGQVRGSTDVVVSEHRPVPLFQHMMVRDQLFDLFERPGESPKINRALLQQLSTGGEESGSPRGRRGQGRGQGRYGRGGGRRVGGGRGRPERGPRSNPASLPAVVMQLQNEDLLPGIFFIFSRQGCDKAVDKCLQAGVRLVTSAESQQIRAIVESRCADLPDTDLRVLEYEKWAAGLARGVAAHHAGMLPAFKAIVEELFEAGLVRVVFATETLALGVNMPARSVVLEKMVKFNGQTHSEITPGEYTQLTGRAGRRGLDTVGHAVVLHRQGLDPAWVGGLASARTYPLRSSFRPSYNMAVNLLSRLSTTEVRDVLESSFAQFQADRSSVDLAARVAEQKTAMAGYADAMACHLGDFAEYARMRRELSDQEKHASKLVGADKAMALDEAAAERKRLKQHPCHGCSDRESHARWEQRLYDLTRDTDGLLRRIAKRTGSMVALFDQVCEVLVACGYLVHNVSPDGSDEASFTVTGAGEMLRRLYSEMDLLLAECLRQGVWNDVEPSTLAAMASALVYNGRGDEVPTVPSLASTPILRAWSDMTHILRDLHATERHHRVPLLPDPDPRAINAMVAWAEGGSLEDVLLCTDITAGDFVRLCRQVIDVVDQIRCATTDPRLAATARKVLDAVDRGVVAYSGGRPAQG